MSWFSEFFTGPDLDYSFYYNPQEAQAFTYQPTFYDAETGTYNTPQNVSRGIESLYDKGQKVFDRGETTFGQAQQYIDPTSDWNKKQRQFLGQGIAEGVGEVTRSQQKELAKSGYENFGLNNLIGAANTGQIGEQLTKGMNTLLTTGVGIGTNLVNAATGLYGQAGQMTYSALTGAGDDAQRNLDQNLANQEDINESRSFNAAASNAAGAFNAGARNDASMFNAGAYNDSKQFEITGRYNQAAQNRAESNAFTNQVISLIPMAFGAPPLPS